MREYREGFPTFLVASILALVAYLAGGWWLWKIDQGRTPVLVEGTEKDGQLAAKIAEEHILAHSWSRWVEATGNGLWTEMQPREAGVKSKTEVRFEDGTTQELAGQDGMTNGRIVAGRVWNGTSFAVDETFFTWNRVQLREGDVDRGERLEKVAALTLAPGEWSDWVVQPDGTSQVIAQMDSYAEAVVKCSLRLDDGTVQVVPAAERWRSGSRVLGIRLHNEGANAVSATVLAWRPLETTSAGNGQPVTPAPSNPELSPQPVASTPARAASPKTARPVPVIYKIAHRRLHRSWRTRRNCGDGDTLARRILRLDHQAAWNVEHRRADGLPG